MELEEILGYIFLVWILELSFLANIYWQFCTKCVVSSLSEGLLQETSSQGLLEGCIRRSWDGSWSFLSSLTFIDTSVPNVGLDCFRRPPLLRRQISWIDLHILQVLPVALAYNLLSSSALIPREPFFWFYSTKVPKQLRNQTLHHAGMVPGLDKNLAREECQKLSLMWQSIIYETKSSSASSAFIFSSASKRGFHLVSFIKPNFQNCCAKTSVQEWIQYLEQISKNRAAFKLLRWHVNRCLLSSPASRNLQFHSMWGSTKNTQHDKIACTCKELSASYCIKFIHSLAA